MVTFVRVAVGAENVGFALAQKLQPDTWNSGHAEYPYIHQQLSNVYYAFILQIAIFVNIIILLCFRNFDSLTETVSFSFQISFIFICVILIITQN
jgi:hypothetical protein